MGKAADKQTDRDKTDRQTDRQTEDRQTETLTDRQKDRQTSTINVQLKVDVGIALFEAKSIQWMLSLRGHVTTNPL